jgi:predicted GIY-YIG superfamily endonuclease
VNSHIDAVRLQDDQCKVLQGFELTSKSQRRPYNAKTDRNTLLHQSLLLLGFGLQISRQLCRPLLGILLKLSTRNWSHKRGAQVGAHLAPDPQALGFPVEVRRRGETVGRELRVKRVRGRWEDEGVRGDAELGFGREQPPGERDGGGGGDLRGFGGARQGVRGQRGAQAVSSCTRSSPNVCRNQHVVVH